MGTNKLLEKLKQVLETNAELNQRKHRDALKKILKKLKAKQGNLKTKYNAAKGDAKPKLEQKLKLVKAHRTKALKALRALKK